MIVVRRTYVPKAGEGGKLLRLVKQANEAMAEAGFGGGRVFRTHTGYHGTIVTDQPWDSIGEYEASRSEVRETSAITSIFDQIYPLLQTTHHTEILEEA